MSRYPLMSRITANAIDALFAWCDEHGFHIPAQFHSHRDIAFLSETDRRDGFNVTGFVSCVVPTYDKPPRDQTRWGWWEFQEQTWIQSRHRPPLRTPSR